MIKNELNYGIALSGGGVRAAVFHLGVLSRLAIDGLLERVTFISTVSGGTLGTGLVFSVSGNRWPTSAAFLKMTIPKVREILVKTNIQKDSIKRLACSPWLLTQGKAKLISESLQHCWKINCTIQDIPTQPRWIINATSYESGKNWRFMPQRMGDYILGYIEEPMIPLSDAMAASAAYPGLIGPLILDSKNYQWFIFGKSQVKVRAEPKVKKIHLWDGGVYDNLGTEALFKPNGMKYRDEYNFLIVSDASKATELTESRTIFHRFKRLINISTEQVRGLRARSLVSHFQENPNSGVYLRIGNTAEYILKQSGMSTESSPTLLQNCLPKEEVIKAASLDTTLRRLSEEEFDRVYKHGWEVANYTLYSRCPGIFQHQGVRQ